MMYSNKKYGMILFLCFIHSLYGQAIIEKPIVAVVCSYNNHEWSEHTLDSIFSQNYSNFRLIIIDDCSSDGNQEVIQNYIDRHQLHDRVTFIQNTVRRRKLFNLYHALYMCDDDEIVAMVDGDDSLAHPNVFSQLNKIYEDDNIWFTYGQYKNVPASQAILWGHREMGYCRPVPKHIVAKQSYRFYSFIYMHLRSFRGWLFKLVKLQDLIADEISGFEGDFYPASNDVAMYFPMVEMAHTHIKFISDIIYVRNLYSEIVGFKVDRKLQTASAREIRKKSCYPVLFKPQKERLVPFKNAQADMIVVCQHDINDIHHLIDNIKSKCISLGTVYIFFSDTTENKALCRKIKNNHSGVIFVPYAATGSKTLKNRLLDGLGCSACEHCIITTDNFFITQPINLTQAILDLEKTYAYRFYLNRDASSISSRCVNLENDTCCWKFSSSLQGWHGVNSMNDMILCRKADLIKDFKQLRFDSMQSLVSMMHRIDALSVRLGLFFKQSKVKSL